MAARYPQDTAQLQAMQRLASLAADGEYDEVRNLATPKLMKVVDPNGRNVLMLVAENVWTPSPTAKCVELFIHLGADPGAQDPSGNRPSHVAARRDHLRLLVLLPFKTKFKKNKEGVTPLMAAAAAESWRCAKHLLHLLREPRYNNCDNQHRLQLLMATNKKGQTAVDVAEAAGHSDLAKVIEIESRLVVNTDGWISGLSASEEQTRMELEILVEDNPSELRKIVTRANCDLPDAEGRTALMLAAQSRAGDEVLDLLLECTADVSCCYWSCRSCSVLHMAAYGDRAGWIPRLVAAGAHANARDADEQTPLYVAVSSGSSISTTVRSLLDAGVNWQLRDDEGRTALDVAAQEGHRELTALLKSYKVKSFFDQPMKLTDADRVTAEERKREDEERRKWEEEERRKREEEERISRPFLENWDKVKFLGRGAFGEVHEVFTDKGIRCAAKIIRLPVQRDEEQELGKEVSKLLAGERNLCNLRHENIVQYLYFTQPDNFTIVLFMELLVGVSLKNFVARPMSKSVREAGIREFSRQICSALEYMHSQKPPVIHRDIKPDNIMVLKEGNRIKLIDFGLSIKLQESLTHFSASSATPMGTMHFMAPELLGVDEPEQNVRYSRESDIWAFGCAVYQMTTGSAPYSGYKALFQIVQILAKHGAPALPASCSNDLREFYNCCVARDPKQRKSAASLLLHQFLSSQNVEGAVASLNLGE